jgi:hypothetical protein
MSKGRRNRSERLVRRLRARAEQQQIEQDPKVKEYNESRAELLQERDKAIKELKVAYNKSVEAAQKEFRESRMEVLRTFERDHSDLIEKLFPPQQQEEPKKLKGIRKKKEAAT